MRACVVRCMGPSDPRRLTHETSIGWSVCVHLAFGFSFVALRLMCVLVQCEVCRAAVLVARPLQHGGAAAAVWQEQGLCFCSCDEQWARGSFISISPTVCPCYGQSLARFRLMRKSSRLLNARHGSRLTLPLPFMLVVEVVMCG